MDETWKDVPRYQGFVQASNRGRIRTLDHVITFMRQGQEQRSRIKGKIKAPFDNYKFPRRTVEGLSRYASRQRNTWWASGLWFWKRSWAKRRKEKNVDI